MENLGGVFPQNPLFFLSELRTHIEILFNRRLSVVHNWARVLDLCAFHEAVLLSVCVKYGRLFRDEHKFLRFFHMGALADAFLGV